MSTKTDVFYFFCAIVTLCGSFLLVGVDTKQPQKNTAHVQNGHERVQTAVQRWRLIKQSHTHMYVHMKAGRQALEKAFDNVLAETRVDSWNGTVGWSN